MAEEKMRNRDNVSRTNLRFEQLEGRRLLAADFSGCAAVDVEPIETCQCEVASAEFPVESEVQMAEMTAGELDPGTPNHNLVEPGSNGPQPLDLSDGMDGYFGSLNADSPTQTMEFSTAADGTATIVMASSMDAEQVSLTITDSNGQSIDALSGGDGPFVTTTFDAQSGETYQLTIESLDSAGDGEFQLTVGFEVFVDQHADAIGAESTELEWNDNQTELQGKLESPGDVDTFRFTSDADGEVMLQLNELVDDDRVDLDIQVLDAQGNAIATGGTNEQLQISFDVGQGEEYFVAVTAGEGQQGDYRIAMELDAVEIQPEVAAAIAEEATSTATETECNAAADSGEVVEAFSEELVTDSVESSDPLNDAAGPEMTEPEFEPDSEPIGVAAGDAELLDEAEDAVAIAIDEPADATSDACEADTAITDEVAAADLNPAEANQPVDTGAKASQPEFLPLDVEVVTTEESSADQELPCNSEIEIDQPIDDPGMPAAAGALIAEAQESLLPADDVNTELESELESELELSQDDGLVLAGDIASDVPVDEQTDQAMTCFFAEESVDEVFGELGSLDLLTGNDDLSQIGTFNMFGGNLNFWANGTGANNRRV